MSENEFSSEADFLSENDETDIKSYLKDADSAISGLNLEKGGDEVTNFCKEYLEKELYKGKGDLPNDEGSSDDLEEVVESSKAEENYNFRFEEPGANEIMTHPRKIRGESRDGMTARKRKREEEKMTKDEKNQSMEKELEEVDEKWHQVFVKNGGKMSNQELTAYNEETAEIIVRYQGESFKYTESSKTGGIEKSLKILEEEEEEEEKIDLGEEEEEEKVEKRDGEDGKKDDSGERAAEGQGEMEPKKKHRGKRGKNHGGRAKRENFIGRGPRRDFKKGGGDRSSTYFAHKR